MSRTRIAQRTAGALALLLAAACASSEGSDGTAAAAAPAATSSRPPAVTGEVIVFAAASLTGTFTDIAESFEAANPGTQVVLSFGASSTLAQQIVSGAPADVFAAASPATMRTVMEAGDATGPQVFVRNSLQIAVPAANPGAITGLSDFADADRTIALCAPAVPCGAAAERVFAASGITPAPDTLEQDVKAALSKVQLGEVDAALVYRTDVLAAGDTVLGIAFPEAAKAANDYPIATLAEAPNTGAAQAFVSYVLSGEALEVLTDAGFDRP